MLSLRSLAFILASAIRRARALSSAALHRSPDRTAEENGYKSARKNAYKNGDRLHVSFPRTVYTFQARTGHPGAVQSKNTINADLGHTQISKMRVFTVCYWAPPLPHLSAKSRNKRSVLRLYARSLSLRELRAKSREHRSYGRQERETGPVLGQNPAGNSEICQRTKERWSCAVIKQLMQWSLCYPRGTGSRGKIASHISISARRQDLASLVDERNAIYRHFLPEEPLV